MENKKPKCLYDTPKSCENSQCRVQNKCNGDKVRPKQELPQLGTKEFNNLASTYFGGKSKEEPKQDLEKDIFENLKECLQIA